MHLFLGFAVVIFVGCVQAHPDPKPSGPKETPNAQPEKIRLITKLCVVMKGHPTLCKRSVPPTETVFSLHPIVHIGDPTETLLPISGESGFRRAREAPAPAFRLAPETDDITFTDSITEMDAADSEVLSYDETLKSKPTGEVKFVL